MKRVTFTKTHDIYEDGVYYGRTITLSAVKSNIKYDRIKFNTIKGNMCTACLNKSIEPPQRRYISMTDLYRPGIKAVYGVVAASSDSYEPFVHIDFNFIGNRCSNSGICISALSINSIDLKYLFDF